MRSLQSSAVVSVPMKNVLSIVSTLIIGSALALTACKKKEEPKAVEPAATAPAKAAEPAAAAPTPATPPAAPAGETAKPAEPAAAAAAPAGEPAKEEKKEEGKAGGGW